MIWITHYPNFLEYGYSIIQKFNNMDNELTKHGEN